MVGGWRGEREEWNGGGLDEEAWSGLEMTGTMTARGVSVDKRLGGI